MRKPEADTKISRRSLFGWGAGLALAAVMPERAPAADPNLTKVWVRYVSGGHSYRPSFASMLLDPLFVEIEIVPFDHPYNMAITPNASGRGAFGPAPGGRAAGAPVAGNAAPVFAEDNPPDLPWIPSSTITSGIRSLLPGGAPQFSVLLLNDQLDWPDDARQNIQRAVEAGKGIVLIHNALADNQHWPWWYQEVTGGLLVLEDHDGMKKSVTTSSATLEVRPVGNHPISRDLATLHLTREEAYKGVWQSPKITPLLSATGVTSDKVVAWIGPSDKARVVCIAPGYAPETHRNPVYRELVRNAIMWAAGRMG